MEHSSKGEQRLKRITRGYRVRIFNHNMIQNSEEQLVTQIWWKIKNRMPKTIKCKLISTLSTLKQLFALHNIGNSMYGFSQYIVHIKKNDLLLTFSILLLSQGLIWLNTFCFHLLSLFSLCNDYNYITAKSTQRRLLRNNYYAQWLHAEQARQWQKQSITDDHELIFFRLQIFITKGKQRKQPTKEKYIGKDNRSIGALKHQGINF